MSDFNKYFILLIILLLGSCTSSKSNYQREYTRVWKEIIKSEAWKNSLLTGNAEDLSNQNKFYVSNSETEIAADKFTTKINMEAVFNERYHSLVSRAYFKIISEAENADSRLKSEYEYWNLKLQDPRIKKDKAFKKRFETVNKRFEAHKQMLDGLKSWNIFSEFRSNDLDFFKAENRNEIHNMYQKGNSEDVIINFLVYRLADLYHYKE